METQLTVAQDKELIQAPSQVIAIASEQARLLMNIVEQTRCFQEISGKKYLQVEAWETIGAFNRVHSETESIVPIVVNGETTGYQAHIQLWKDGQIVGGAVMPCFFTENCCKGKEGDAKHKAAMSAAQTFATSKAYRMNYSYVAILAGYQPTPAEEVTEDFATQEPNKTEHFCKEHNTDFFKSKKMRSFAHPIGDTGEWCYEHTDKVEKPATPATEPTEGIVDKVEKPITTTQDLLEWVASHGKSFHRTWVTKNCSKDPEKDPVGCYEELKALQEWK